MHQLPQGLGSDSRSHMAVYTNVRLADIVCLLLCQVIICPV